jgi:anti-sigma factor RsiW
MTSSPCPSLDDYLAHDLTGAALARFVAHLPSCPACDRAVREHERLATLLTLAVSRLEPVPAGLTERVRSRLRAARRRRFAAAAAALAAAVVAAVWLFARTAPRPDEPPAPLAGVQPEPPAEQVRVTFPAGANVIAVPAAVESPNVTVIWVYPGLRTPPQPAPSTSHPPSSPERSDT